MNTIIIVVAALVLAVAIFFYCKGRSLTKEAELRKKDLDTVYNGLMKKERELDLWERQLRTTMVDFAACQKVWGNYVVEAGANVDDRAIYKSLASKLGYATMKFFSNRIRMTEKEDGRKVYSIEVNVIPYKKTNG